MKSGSKGESHSPKNHSNMAENQKLKETITHSIPQTRVSSESVSPTTSTSVSTPQKNGFPMASPSTSGSGKRRTAMHKIKDPNIKGSPAEPSSNQIITEEEKNRLEAVQRDWRLSRPTKSYAKSSHMLYDGPSITQKSNSPNITPRKIVLSSSMKSPSVTNNIHPTEDEKAVENVNLHDPASIFGDSAQNIISNVDLHVSVDSMGHSTDTSGYLTTHQHSDVKQETNIPPPIIEITESSVVIEPIAEITEKCETAVEQPSVDESKMVEEIVKEEVKVKKARDRRKIRTLSSTSSECTSSSEDEEIFRAFSTTGREKHVESEEEVEEKPIDKSPDGRFLKFDEEIGSGSFKTVYRGLDSETGVAVAWCELQENKLNKAERQRFREEAEMLKGLQHPNIVRFYDYWERQDGSKRKYIVLVTELMSSGTLKTYIKRFKKFNAKVLKSWCRQILKGLSFLHSRNPPVIHRDLKCDNIFITGTTGSVKIGDLGLATLKNKSHAKSVIGTPEFMAPEMYDEMYDEMVDIYAFGMCLLEMVTGEYPYAECNSLGQIYKKVVAGIKPECFNRIPEEYPEIKEIIDRCIRLHKEERVNVKQLLSDDCFIPDEDLGIRIDIINRDTELTGTNTEIKMQLKIFNDEKRKLYQFKENEGLQFAFDIMQDNPEEVVQQMIDQQHVPENEKRWIIKLVRDKMDAFKRDREFRHSEAKRLREEEERKAEYFAIQEELKLRAIEKIRKENERIENERIESERIENETNQQEALANQARLQQQRMLEDQASQEQVQQNNGHIIRQGFINPINVQETTNCELSSFSSRLDDLEMPMTPNGDVIDGAKSKKSRRKVVIVVKEITRENDDTTYIHAILDTNTRSITFTFQLETHHPSLIIRQLVEGNCLEESNAGLVEELLSTVITKIKEEPDDTIGMKVMNVYDNSGNIIKLSEMTTVPSVKKQLPPRLDESIVDSGSNVPPTCKSRFGVTPVSIPPCTSTLPDHQNAPTLSPTFIEPQVANLQAQFQGNNSSSINNQTNLTQSPSSSRPENAPLSPVVVNSRFTVQPTACAPEPKTLQQVNTSTTDNIENIVQTHNLPQQHAETVTLPEHVAQHISEVTFINPAVNANTVHGNMVYQQPIPMTNNPLVCEKKLTNSKLKGTHLEALEQELRKVSGVTGVTEDGEIISTSHICQSHQNTISNPNKDMYYSPPRTHQQYFHLNNLNLYTEENHQPQTYVYSEMTGNTQQVNNFAPPDLNNTNNVQANYMEQEHTSFNVEDSRPKTQQSFTTEHNIMSPTISKQHTSEHSRSVSPHSRQGYYPETTFIPQDNRVYDGQHLHYQPPQNQSSHMQQPPIVHQQQPQVAEQTHTGIIQHPQVQVVQQPGTPLIQGHFHYPHQQNIQLQQNQQQHIQQNVAHQQPHMHHHVDTHHIPSQMPVHHQNQSQQQQHQQQPQFQQMQQPQLQHQQPQHQIQHQQAQQFQSQPQQHQTQPQQYQSQPHQHQPQLQPQPQQHQPQPQQHQPQHQQLQPQTQQYQSQPQQQHQSHVQTSAIAVHHQPLKSNMAQHKSQTLPPVSHQQSTVHHAAGEPHVHYQHLPTEKVHTHVDMGTKICHHVPPPSHHYQTVPAQHFHQHPAVYNSTMSPLLPSDPHILDMQELLNQMIATNMFYQQQGHQFQNQMEQLISRSQQVNSQNYCNLQQEKNQSAHYGHQHSIHHTQLTNVQQQGGTGEYLSNTSSHSQTPAIIKQPSHSLHGLNEKLNILSQKQQNNEPLFTQSLCPSLQFIPKMASEDDGQGTSNQMTYPSTVVPGTHQVKTFVGLENALKKVIHPDMRDSQSVPPSVVQGKELVQSSANGTIQGHPHQITELELYQNFNNLPIHFHSCHPHDHYDTIDADVGTIDLELSIYREDLVQLTLLRHRRELQELRDRQCNELRHIKHKASMLRSKSMTPRSKNNNVVVNHSCCFKCPCC